MTQDLENQMVIGHDDPEPERDEDLEYETVRQEQIDDLAAVLRDIGTIRFIDFKLAQAD